ncbi:hypothetical protein GQ54DRAFT_69306 [Martensiomyces pterosporus]|nr:hypothetical protein GQ54DRAFT_69306 [Martensiomyces pterosporus]
MCASFSSKQRLFHSTGRDSRKEATITSVAAEGAYWSWYPLSVEQRTEGENRHSPPSPRTHHHQQFAPTNMKAKLLFCSAQKVGCMSGVSCSCSQYKSACCICAKRSLLCEHAGDKYGERKSTPSAPTSGPLGSSETAGISAAARGVKAGGSSSGGGGRGGACAWNQPVYLSPAPFLAPAYLMNM